MKPFSRGLNKRRRLRKEDGYRRSYEAAWPSRKPARSKNAELDNIAQSSIVSSPLQKPGQRERDWLSQRETLLNGDRERLKRL